MRRDEQVFPDPTTSKPSDEMRGGIETSQEDAWTFERDERS